MSIISDISIRRPVFAWMLMSALIIFGAIGFNRMGVSQLPDVDFPVVTLNANYEGASPEVMETEVVDVLEDAMMSLEGVKSISSSSKQGSASITVEFDLNRNIDLAIQDVQAKAAQAARRLPRDLEPLSVSKTNPEDQPILWISAQSSSLSRRELNLYVSNHLKDQFSTLPGVGEVFLGGYVDPNLRIWVDAEKLAQLDLAVTDVINAISNEHREAPAGKIEGGRTEFNVRTLGEMTSVKEFEKLLITQRGGSPNYNPIPLKDIATVEEGLADIRRLSRANGQTAIGLGIRKQRGANAVAVAQAARSQLENLRKSVPKEVQLGLVFDSTRFIEEAVHELNFTLVLSALLTAVVCWVFLASWSSTLNVILAIPTSIVGSFIILYFSGFTLNTFTLLALSLAIGIVVDDAIMVLENIMRHREMGKSRVQAAQDGAREITFAALSATLAIVAIFLPVAFMKGVIGKFFFQFGVTMTAAVLLSLLEALTLTPMRCAQFIESGDHRRSSGMRQALEKFLGALTTRYKRSLTYVLDHRWKTIFLAFACFAASMAVLPGLNKEFIPKEDQSRFVVRVQTPVGSSLAFTDKKFEPIEAYLKSQPEVETYLLSVGGMGGGDVNTGMIFVTLKPRSQRSMDQFEFMDQMRKKLGKIPETKVFLQDLSMRGFTASRGLPVEFNIRGPDWEQLATHAHSVINEMEKAGLYSDIDSDYRLGMPEVRIIPNRNKAAEHGVSVGAIADTVSAFIGGVLVGRYPSGGHRYDIRLRLKEDTQDRVQKISSLKVRNNRGELIPLSEVIKVEEKPTLQAISRKDRERAITVFANLKKGVSQAVALERIESITQSILPFGYRAVLSGSSESFKESFQSLLFALALGLAVAYMVLASQFNSYIDPVIVLLALPFSISGAFFALKLGNQSINLYSMIGILLLMGIVKKNSILLVDFTNQLRESRTLSVHDALLEACPTRLRPILMTSLATVVGAIPPALALGPGAEARIPMAMTVIGGVTLSTVLTLYVVPCAYSLMGALKKKHT